MEIEVSTDRNIQGGADLHARVQGMVHDALAHFSQRITRVEAHLSDENSVKGGDADKRCMLEARLGGMRPIAVTHCADTLAQAIVGATDKLDRALQHSLGKADRGSRMPGVAHAPPADATPSSENQSEKADHDD